MLKSKKKQIRISRARGMRKDVRLQKAIKMFAELLLIGHGKHLVHLKSGFSDVRVSDLCISGKLPFYNKPGRLSAVKTLGCFKNYSSIRNTNKFELS